MFNLFRRNTIENHFKKVSITGRVAFGTRCLEQYIVERNMKHNCISKIIDTLWEFMDCEDLTEWDNKISDLDPSNILDTHPANTYDDYRSLTKLEFQEFQKFYSSINNDFLLLIQWTIDIGVSNLYGATGRHSKSTLTPTMKVYNFAKDNIKAIPNINVFLVSKYSERYGWGNKISKEAFK